MNYILKKIFSNYDIVSLHVNNNDLIDLLLILKNSVKLYELIFDISK